MLAIIYLTAIGRFLKVNESNVAFGAARVDGLVWLLSGFSFAVAAIIFGIHNRTEVAMMASAATLSVGGVAFYISIIVAKKARDSAGLGASQVVPLINRIAWLIIVLCLIVLFIIAVFFRHYTVGATVVAAMIGMTAGFMSTRVSIKKKFSDKIRVFSGSTGTQFVCPVELILNDQVIRDIRLLQLAINGPSTDNIKRSSSESK